MGVYPPQCLWDKRLTGEWTSNVPPKNFNLVHAITAHAFEFQMLPYASRTLETRMVFTCFFPTFFPLIDEAITNTICVIYISVPMNWNTFTYLFHIIFFLLFSYIIGQACYYYYYFLIITSLPSLWKQNLVIEFIWIHPHWRRKNYLKA